MFIPKFPPTDADLILHGDFNLSGNDCIAIAEVRTFENERPFLSCVFCV